MIPHILKVTVCADFFPQENEFSSHRLKEPTCIKMNEDLKELE